MRSNQPNDPNRTRRRFLRWVGGGAIVGTAGCSGTTPDDQPTETTETREPIETPTETATKTTTETPEIPAEAWRLYSYDVRNSGHNPSTYGPKAVVESRWKFETDAAIRSSPALVDGTVYIGSDDGHLYAIDAETGKENWAYRTDGPIVSSPAVFDSKVYVGSNDHNVYALSTETGEELWKYETREKVQSSPTVDSNRELREFDPVVAIGSDDGSLYALNAETGDVYDAISTGGPIRTTPMINYFGTLEIFCGSADGSVYDWEAHVEPEPIVDDRGAPIHSSVVVASDPRGGEFPPWYFGTDAGKLYRAELYSANEWEFEMDGKIRSSPALTSDTVYAGSWGGNVYAIDDQEGAQRWAFETDGKVDSSPAVADETVYIGSNDQSVYALDGKTGDELWAFETGGAVRSSPAVVDGTLYVGSDDNILYALAES